jgi:hypothetical protein
MKTNESTLAIRKVLGKRFMIAPHLIKPEDIKTLMGYMHIGDLHDMTVEEVNAFVAAGRGNGLLRNGDAS